jgi:hypothetical protein
MLHLPLAAATELLAALAADAAVEGAADATLLAATLAATDGASVDAEAEPAGDAAPPAVEAAVDAELPLSEMVGEPPHAAISVSMINSKSENEIERVRDNRIPPP